MDEDNKERVKQEIKRARSYGSRHLKGLTVGHSKEVFKEGQQLILTLRDKDVLDESDDVLENVNLIDEEKTKKNNENKIKRPEYKPYDEPEFDEFGILQKKSLLSKYDEEIEGIKKESFKIGDDNREQELEVIRTRLRQNEGKVSLELPKLKLATEYYTPEEMEKFKKPKKKIKKVLRKKEKEFTSESLEPIADSENDLRSRNEINQVEQDNKSTKNTVNLNVIDDDMEVDNKQNNDVFNVVLDEDEAEEELQIALHKARKLKSRVNATASTGADSIAKVVQQINKRPKLEDDDNDPSKSSSGMIILNRTDEFCRNLGDIPTYGMSGNREEDEDLNEMDDIIEDKSKYEHDSHKSKWNEVEMNEADEEDSCDTEETEEQPILEEEPDVSVGLAGALKLAMKKGYLDKEAKKNTGAPRLNRIQAQSYTIEEKFYEDEKSTRRERYNGPVSEFREKEGYKPDIKLEYVDDGGKLLDQKEAFRHLSHKFHGKGPGKNKIDKRMKKKDQESKLRQMSSIDTPLNTLKMLQERQKELQSPYVVLTGQKTLPPTIAKSKK